MGGWELRVALPDDELLIENLYSATVANLPGGGDPTRSLLKRGAEYRAQGGELWSVIGNGAVCGCMGVLPDGQGGAELSPILLSPGWQGLGLGGWLVRSAAEFAKERGFSPLWVQVPPLFAAVQPKLLACGFTPAEVPSLLSLPDDHIYLQLG
ncbi:MAG: GNAT family N-acetyltransferase [Planctomycetota bacterium]|jgi:GNAT superfamily N-acetyltransferase